ncbi:MAG: ComEC/Rec2 family competence protein [Patescibacteria group bacterium UBA2163]
MYTKIIFFISFCVIVGAAVYSLTTPIKDEVLGVFENKNVSLHGVVIRDPDIRENAIRLTVAPKTVNGLSVSNAKNVLVVTNRFTEVSYGDYILVEGKLRKPEPFETDSGRTFDYPRYLFAHSIFYSIPFADVSVQSVGHGNQIFSVLFTMKHALIRGIERALPEPHAALAAGLLLGEKQSLGNQLYETFIASGLVHIIVLSGYNVALVINSVLFLTLRVLPRTTGYVVAVVFVLGFAILTGASETTVRATIMALFMMIARVLHRPAVALRGLLLAAVIMALWNPFLVLYDLSFQLSVLATFGLIVLSDPISKRLVYIPKRFGLREITATTLATQVAVLPLLVLSIGAVSLTFLPANVLVLPLVPLAMLFSFIAALIALTLPTVVFPFATFAYGVLAYIMNVSIFFGTLPFALITIPSHVTWMVLSIIVVTYSVYGVHALRRYNVQK